MISLPYSLFNTILKASDHVQNNVSGVTSLALLWALLLSPGPGLLGCLEIAGTPLLSTLVLQFLQSQHH